jgi:hypothetical protein
MKIENLHIYEQFLIINNEWTPIEYIYIYYI